MTLPFVIRCCSSMVELNFVLLYMAQSLVVSLIYMYTEVYD